MELYIPAFLIASCASCVLLYIITKTSDSFAFAKSPVGGRHIGSPAALRLGGIALLGGFLLSIYLDRNLILDTRTVVFIGGLTAFVLIGFLDDIWSLHWRVQLGLQAFVTAIIFFLGIRIDFISSPLGVISFTQGSLIIGCLVTVVWVVMIINALNWADGMDGLSGGVTFIAAIALFALALRADVYQPPLAIICVALAGSVLAFTCANLSWGKIYAGSSGSYFMGYAIAVIAIFAGAKIGAALLVLIVPLVDALYVLFRRYRDRVSLFSGDTRHLHHKLLEVGFEKWKILVLYYGLTILGACCAVFLQSWNKLILLIVYGGLLFFALAYFSYQTKTSSL